MKIFAVTSVMIKLASATKADSPSSKGESSSAAADYTAAADSPKRTITSTQEKLQQMLKKIKELPEWEDDLEWREALLKVVAKRKGPNKLPSLIEKLGEYIDPPSESETYTSNRSLTASTFLETLIQDEIMKARNTKRTNGPSRHQVHQLKRLDCNSIPEEDNNNITIPKEDNMNKLIKQELRKVKSRAASRQRHLPDNEKTYVVRPIKSRAAARSEVQPVPVVTTVEEEECGVLGCLVEFLCCLCGCVGDDR